MRVALPERVEDRRVGQLDGVPGPRRSAAPAVEDDERYERERRAAVRQIAVKESTSREAPPTSAPSTSGCGQELLGVLGLDGAAVEDPARSSRLRMKACASWAVSGVAVLPVPIAQTGS